MIIEQKTFGEKFLFFGEFMSNDDVNCDCYFLHVTLFDFLASITLSVQR